MLQHSMEATNRLVGLDALRGVAALCVFWLHLSVWFEGVWRPDKAYLAVDFFFLLSGYVMARTYEPSLLDRSLLPQRFVVKRVWRLWPTVMVGCVIGLIPLHWNQPEGMAWVVLANVLLMPALWSYLSFPLNGPAFSIHFELFANIVHAFLLVKVRTGFLLFAAGGLAILCAVIINQRGNLAGGAGSWDFWVGYPRVMLSYILGIVMFRWWRDRTPLRHGWIALPLMPIIFIAMTLASANDLLFVFIGSPMLLLLGLAFACGTVSKWSGRLSFPLYAIHNPVIIIVADLSGPIWLAVIASIAMAFGIAWAGSRDTRSGLLFNRNARKHGSYSVEARSAARYLNAIARLLR